MHRIPTLVTPISLNSPKNLLLQTIEQSFVRQNASDSEDSVTPPYLRPSVSAFLVFFGTTDYDPPLRPALASFRSLR